MVYKQIQTIMNEDKNLDEWEKKVYNHLSIVDRKYYYAVKSLFEENYKTIELQTIKNQILLCITFGLYMAAMTLTNHLLEKFLKSMLSYNDALKYKEQISYEEKFALPEQLERSRLKFDSQNLDKNIDTAFSEKLIDENQNEVLKGMKNNFRNAYSHDDRKKMYGDASTPIEESRDPESVLKGEPQPSKEFKLSGLSLFEFLFINNFSEMHCVPYITNLHQIILSVESKLYKSTS